MKRRTPGLTFPSFFPSVLLIALLSFFLTLLSCTKPAPQPKAPPSRPSDINVQIKDGGPALITTTTAEFQILPSGFVQATLMKDGKRLTLDEPDVGSTGGSDFAMIIR